MKHSYKRKTGVLQSLGVAALCAALSAPAMAQGAAPASELATKYSSGDYRQVLALPDELVTVFDPNTVGNRMRYQSPAINDSGFVTTKTYSTPWAQQGLGAMRRGAVWYRYRFTLPADVKGKPVGLLVGGYQDEARVWINGKLVGTSGETAAATASGPAAFDLTDGINYDGQNLVAIQVVRHGDANTNRTGGLLKQSFIFTGPRLAQKANKPLELRRVLPGGELGEVQE